MNARIAAMLLAGVTGLLVLAGDGRAAPSPDPALRARNPRLEVQWTNPGTRPAPFDKVMLAPVVLDFRPVRPLTGPTGAGGTRTEFPVSERGREALAADTNRILREELARSTRFTLVDQAGPGVLVLQPALRDIVSRTPPEEPPGRSDVLLDSAGEATLVVTFVDGGSGATLGTATDRRSAEGSYGPGNFGAVQGNAVGVTQEVRRVVRRWGANLTRRVEELQAAATPR